MRCFVTELSIDDSLAYLSLMSYLSFSFFGASRLISDCKSACPSILHIGRVYVTALYEDLRPKIFLYFFFLLVYEPRRTRCTYLLVNITTVLYTCMQFASAAQLGDSSSVPPEPRCHGYSPILVSSISMEMRRWGA